MMGQSPAVSEEVDPKASSPAGGSGSAPPS